MSRIETMKMRWRAMSAELIGSPVKAASMVVPPGSSLYTSYSPNMKARSRGGPLVELFAPSPSATVDAEGAAGDMPTQMGILAVTDSSLVFLKKKDLGAAPLEVLTSWLIAGITLTAEVDENWDYSALAIEFADGTGCVLMGEKQWPLAELAAAASR